MGDMKKRAMKKQYKVICLVSNKYRILFFVMKNYQVLVLAGIFLFCWTPYALLSLAGICGLAEVSWPGFVVTILMLYQVSSTRD